MFESRVTRTDRGTGRERPSSRGPLAIARSDPAANPLHAWQFWALAAAILLLPSFALVGCGDDDSDAADSGNQSATTVNVTERDGTIDLDRASSSSGDVEFAIKNAGELTHEFVVLKTDLAEDTLPLVADQGAVDQSGDGVDVVGEKSSISPGADATLVFDDLADGNYVIICNVPGHYGLGMHASFVVG
jgi:uncharacterized cupredoxin-like copper-binding protein